MGMIDGDVMEQALAIRFGKEKDLPGAIERLPLPQLPSDLIAVHDQALALAQMRCAGAGSCFLAEPSVLIRSETLDLAPGEAGVTMRTGIDIASQGLSGVGQVDDAVAMHGAWASELEQQVLDDAPAHSAAEVLRAAGEQGVAIRRVVSPEDLSALTGVSADARAVMAQQLKDGAAALIAPTRMVQVGDAGRYAWWRIDPAGQVLAIAEDGRGQAGSEGMTVLEHVSIPMVRRCMTFVKCFNQSIASGGGMNESAAECLSQSIQDVVKQSVDQAIETFIKSPLQDAMNDAMTNMRQDVIGEDYEKLYQQAKQAYAKYQQAQQAISDPAGQVPGVQEGRAAADAGAQIGQDFGFRIYLLLDMGSDIAEFAGGL
jgi:hypothetical protein